MNISSQMWLHLTDLEKKLINRKETKRDSLIASNDFQFTFAYTYHLICDSEQRKKPFY